MYALTLSEDIALFDGMADVTGYVGMQEFLNKISFGRNCCHQENLTETRRKRSA